MKKVISTVGFCLLFIATAGANSAIPAMDVTVSDTSGRLAYKGVTKSNGAFATEKLQHGNYIVQLSSKKSTLKGAQYSIVLAAGKKRVVANSVAADKFLGAGVAMKVDVGAGLGIIGYVSAGPVPTEPAPKDTVRKMQDGIQDQHRDGIHVRPGS